MGGVARLHQAVALTCFWTGKARFRRMFPMNARRFLVGAAGLALLGGCGSLVLTEADSGQTREVARGTEFSLSLPAVQGSPREPKIQGAFIRFLGRRAAESSGREIFEFRADGLGEGDIRIAPDIAIRVRVVAPDGARMRAY
jgi:hypothetical protein